MFPAFNKVGIGLRPRVEMVSSMQCLSLWSLELSICHGYRGINRPSQLSMVSPEGRGRLVPLGVSEELEGSRRYVCRDGKEMTGARLEGQFICQTEQLGLHLPSTRSALHYGGKAVSGDMGSPIGDQQDWMIRDFFSGFCK